MEILYFTFLHAGCLWGSVMTVKKKKLLIAWNNNNFSRLPLPSYLFLQIKVHQELILWLFWGQLFLYLFLSDFIFFSFSNNSFKIYLFIYVFLAALGSSLLRTGFLQLQRAGATLPCGVWASHCGGFSCCGAWALGVLASVVAARKLSSCGSWALECRLSSCGTRALLLRGMWDLPGPGFEPVSPALAGGFLTTEPSGKSLFFSDFKKH